MRPTAKTIAYDVEKAAAHQFIVEAADSAYLAADLAQDAADKGGING